MKANRTWTAVLILGLLALSLNPSVLRSEPAVSNAKLLGSWDVEVMADGQSYYLIMVLTENQNKLEGKISEQNGFFTDVALDTIAYDGQSLTFNFIGPTPPDGVARLIQCELKWAGDNLEGTLVIPDLNIAAPTKAVKKA